MLRCVSVDAIGVESLPKHQHGFAVRAWISRGVGKVDVGRKSDIARDFLPDKMKSVGGGPDVGSGSRDRVGTRAVVHGTGRHDVADIRMSFEDAERIARGCRGSDSDWSNE